MSKKWRVKQWRISWNGENSLNTNYILDEFFILYIYIYIYIYIYVCVCVCVFLIWERKGSQKSPETPPSACFVKFYKSVLQRAKHFSNYFIIPFFFLYFLISLFCVRRYVPLPLLSITNMRDALISRIRQLLLILVIGPNTYDSTQFQGCSSEFYRQFQVVK